MGDISTEWQFIGSRGSPTPQTTLFHHEQHRHLLAFEATLQRLGAFDVAWFTADEWANGEKGQSTLY
jgi:hypothetical protein